jgi:hypothetical protein
MPESRDPKLDDELRALRQSLHALELRISQPIVTQYNDSRSVNAELPPDVRRLREKLRRGARSLKRIGNGFCAVAGFLCVAFLAALFANQLNLASGAITIGAALFFGLAGEFFHSQADAIDIGDAND